MVNSKLMLILSFLFGCAGLMLGFCGDCGNLLIVELLKTEGRRDVFDLLQRFVVLRHDLFY